MNVRIRCCIWSRTSTNFWRASILWFSARFLFMNSKFFTHLVVTETFSKFRSICYWKKVFWRRTFCMLVKIPTYLFHTCSPTYIFDRNPSPTYIFRQHISPIILSYYDINILNTIPFPFSFLFQSLLTLSAVWGESPVRSVYSFYFHAIIYSS